MSSLGFSMNQNKKLEETHMLQVWYFLVICLVHDWYYLRIDGCCEFQFQASKTDQQEDDMVHLKITYN